MPTIVEMGFMLNIVNICSFILYQFITNCTVLYSYKCSYKTCYYIFHAFYIVQLQVQLQDQLLHIPCILHCMVTSVVTRPVISLLYCESFVVM